MTLLTILAAAAVLSVVLTCGAGRGARRVEQRDPAYWRRRGVL